MPTIHTVEKGTNEGQDGFIIEWEMIGFTKKGAEFRAVGMTAARFPTTLTNIDVVAVREFGERDYNVRVFVPIEGFLSAGIANPLEWMKDQYGKIFMED